MNRQMMAAAMMLMTVPSVLAHVMFPSNLHRFHRNGEKTVLIWRTNGTVKVTKPCTVELLLVGGGGGGGSFNNATDLSSSGGGGAGGFLHKIAYTLTPNDYQIVVGAGGAPSVNGGNTTAFGLTAYGGGAGGARNGSQAPGNGASGGGASRSSSATGDIAGGRAIYNTDDEVQGHDGLYARAKLGGGGGGGAGAAAPDDRESETQPGSGGDGLPCSITGQEIWYAGGGAGSRMEFPMNRATSPCLGGKGGGGSVRYSTDVLDRQGTDGLGGGGAGGYRGGSGVVIVSFVDDDEQDNTDDFAISGDGMLFGSVSESFYGRIFRADGKLTVTGSGSVDLLLVGGGGGGGNNGTTYGGAGGGAGGFVCLTNVPVVAGTYDIKVGAGGSVSQNGGDSSALSIVAYGGGAGSNAAENEVGRGGGSGGGSCVGTVSGADEVLGGEAVNKDDNVGHNGGKANTAWGPGGGGGAGAPGGDSDMSGTTYEVTAPGNGGDGLPCFILGRELWYAGGGAGFRQNLIGKVPGGRGGGAACGAAGMDGKGGGGSGGSAGGSGIVIVRVNQSPRVKVDVERGVVTGGAMTHSHQCNIHTFTSNGVFTASKDVIVEVLAVGGGAGGGANGNEYGGGGGGAGGYVHREEMLLEAGTYEVVVGKGGAIGENGGDTKVFDIIAHGGGAGARSENGNKAQNGASGGGATMSKKETTADPQVVMSRIGGNAIYAEDENGAPSKAWLNL